MILSTFRVPMVLPVAGTLVCLAASLPAQCSTLWLPGDGIPGVQGAVRAIHAWDPDGAGPAPAWTVVGGTFWAAGTVPVRNIAAWDPATGTWSSLGGGAGGGPFESVDQLLSLPGGDLLAVGKFLEAGGVTCNNIARWDGSQWWSLAGGLDQFARSATVLANGDVVVVGSFQFAGGVPVSGAARWDGAAWSAFGPTITTIAAAPNGELYGLGAAPSRWTGATWAPLGSGVTLLGTYRMLVLPNSDLVVSALALVGGQVEWLIRWDGTAWSPIPRPSGWGFVSTMSAADNGDLVAANGADVQRWNGVQWTPVAQLPDLETLVVLPGDHLVAASSFSPYYTTRVQRWSGSAWDVLGGGADGPLNKIVVMPDGSRVAAGLFRMIGGIAADRIARWDGATWAPLGTGFADPNANVLDAVAMPDGDLVVAGHFTEAGGVAANRVARWNGTAWSAVGAPGLDGPSVVANNLLALPDGDLIVAGRFTHAGGVPAANIARWDGTNWSPLGSGTDGDVLGLVLLPDGDVVASGSFTHAGGAPVDYVARWDGTSWSPLGTSATRIVVRLVDSAGDLVGVRSLAAPGGEVVRWDGNAWTAVGGPLDDWRVELEELPNGDLVAGGFLLHAGGVPAERIARWDGTAWSPIGAGVGFASVSDVVMDHGRGELLVGGSFVFAGGEASSYLARIGTDCPAVATPHGNGCASSGGANTLTAVTLPWVDATFRSRAIGLPSTAIAATLVSFTPVAQGALPLNSVFAQAPAGCDVLVAPDILGIVAAASGVAEYEAFLPNTPPLVGLTFFHQMVPFEFDVLGNVVAITATNALELTAGAF